VINYTPCEKFGHFWAKREDRAGCAGPEYPGGAKVRQFMAMAANSPGAPMIVGCSSDSAMQIYIAAAAKLTGAPGIVYCPARKVRSAATEYAARLGAEINEVRPGYLSVCKARARARAKEIGEVVRWNPKGAIADPPSNAATCPPQFAVSLCR
jgi:hypothetical protein